MEHHILFLAVLNSHVRRSIFMSVAQFPSLNSHVSRFKCFPLQIQQQVDQCSQSQLPRSLVTSLRLVYGQSALSEFSKWISAVSHCYCAVSHQSLPRLDEAPDGTSQPILRSPHVRRFNFHVRCSNFHVRRFYRLPILARLARHDPRTSRSA